MYSWIVLWLVLAGAKVGFAGLARDKQGPYIIIMRIIEDCSERDDGKIKIFPKMRRMDRKMMYVNGTVVMKIPIDNKLKFTFELAQKTPQGYKEKFYSSDFQGMDICTALEKYGDDASVARFFKSFDGGNYTGCPIEAGRHEFHLDLLVAPSKMVPIFFYNTYRTYVRFYEDLNGPPEGCLMLLCDVVPKPKRKG